MIKKIYLILLVCLTGILLSCSEDDVNKPHDHHEHSEYGMRKNKVSFQNMKDFLSKESSSLPFSLNLSLSKGESSYITAIDSTNITQIVIGDVTTFTLHVNTLDDGLYTFSNLIIKSHNGQTQEYVLHYNPTQEWLSAYNSGVRLPYDGTLNITDINGNETNIEGGTQSQGRFGTGPCETLVIIRIPCYGTSCPCTDGNGQEFYIIQTLDDCDDGGSGGNPTDPGNGNPWDDPGGGGNPGSGGTNPGDGGGSNPGDGGGSNPGDGPQDPGDWTGTAPDPGAQTDPCQSLKNKLDAPLQNNKSFKTRLQELKNFVPNSVDEKGYGNQNPNEDPNINSDITNQYNPLLQVTKPDGSKAARMLVVGPQMFGYMHTHPDQPSTRGVHSMAEFRVFLNMVKERLRNDMPVDNTYGIVVGNHGVYSLKIDDMSKFLTGYYSIHNRTEFDKFWDKFEKDYKKLMQTIDTYPNTKDGNEKALLKLLKTVEDMTGIKGVYRANDNLTGWNRLKLNSSGNNVNSTPCS